MSVSKNTTGEQPVPESAAIDAFIENYGGATSVETIDADLDRRGLLGSVFGFEMADLNYPHAALDVVIDDGHRLFVHQTFQPERQELPEAVLTDAGLHVFPVVQRTDDLTFRFVRGTAQKLISLDFTVPTARTISDAFLAPTLLDLYHATGSLPSVENVTNLVAVEEIKTSDGSDSIHTGAYFLPPYNLSPVAEADFVDSAVARAHIFGPRISELLRAQLQTLVHEA
jgi:hypothetical protein